jgi:gluconolactonase
VTLTPAGAVLLDVAATAASVGEPGQFGFTEGPVYSANRGSWIFSDIPMATQYEFVPSTGTLQPFRKPSNNSNGNFLDNAGRLLTCEHKGRVLSRTDLATGERTVLADEYNGELLTSPNDCIVSRKTGAIYFTDPSYGTMSALGHGEPTRQMHNRVYRLDPTDGNLSSIESSFVQPNGLCFSPDESLLYIADSGAGVPNGEYTASNPHHVRVFDVTDGGKSIANGRLFCTVAEGNGLPDGIRCDSAGNIWVCTGEGVNVYSSGGEMVAKILTPATIANCAFGGPHGMDLMLTASESVWIIPTKVQGAGDIGPAGARL